MMPQIRTWYSIVRIVPDPLREEFLNVGIVVVSQAGFSVRVLPAPTSSMRALAPPNVRSSLTEIQPYLIRHLDNEDHLNTLLSLVADGISGYLLTEPRERILDLRKQDLQTLCANLYQDFVEPRHWVERPTRSHTVRLDADLRRQLRREALPVGLAAIGLQLRRQDVRFDFPLAFVNGSLNLFQTVDLDVQPESQRANFSRAIAQIAEVDRVLALSDIEWTSVVRTGEGSRSLQSRLGLFSTTVTTADIPGIVQRVRREAIHPIDRYFQSLGAEVERRDDSLEVEVKTSSPSSRI